MGNWRCFFNNTTWHMTLPKRPVNHLEHERHWNRSCFRKLAAIGQHQQLIVAATVWFRVLRLLTWFLYRRHHSVQWCFCLSHRRSSMTHLYNCFLSTLFLLSVMDIQTYSNSIIVFLVFVSRNEWFRISYFSLPGHETCHHLIVFLMEGLSVGFLVWESPMIRAEWYTMKLVILPLEGA